VRVLKKNRSKKVEKNDPDGTGAMTASAVSPKKTALNSVHCKLGAKMVDFGGWDMPVQYSGILARSIMPSAVELGCSMSAIWAIEIQWRDALAVTNSMTTNAVAKLKIGQPNTRVAI
jgi:aminomethyltransferase